MPKRQNPFGESSPLQFKTRIGKKEVDLGVCAEKNMESVYAKTKSMMFEAARQGTDTATQVLTSDASDTCRVPPQPAAGQLRIDSSGKLCARPVSEHQAMEATDTLSPLLVGCKNTAAFMFNNNNYLPTLPVTGNQLQLDPQGGLTLGSKVKHNPFQSMASQKIQCHSCRVLSQTLQGCSFCDKKTCHGCLRTCEQCSGTFCHVCSVLNYDDCMERAFCLQCSP